MKKTTQKIGFLLSIMAFLFFLVGCEWGTKPLAVPVYQGMTYEIEESSQVVLRQGEYYASKNAYVVISANFLNPDNQTILSLEINDIEYLSFQFRTGSTNSKVLILVDSGSDMGAITYTISDILYLNKDQASDVVMTGNQVLTLQVIGNNIPSASLDVADKSYTYANINAEVADSDSVINPLTLRLEVYKNGIKEEERTLTRGTNRINLESLIPNTGYEIKVVATYSLFDEFDQVDVILAHQSFVTLVKTVTMSQITYTSAQFSLIDGGELTLQKIELLKSSEIVETFSNLSKRSVENLLSNTNYQLKVTYVGPSENEIVILSQFKTLTKTIPAVEFVRVIPGETQVTFALTVSDRQMVGTLTKLEVYKGATLIESFTDLQKRIVENLETNYEYRLLATYTYNLNDGFGERHIVTETRFTTSTPSTVSDGSYIDLEKTVTEVVERVSESVIGVSNYGPVSENNSSAKSLGSGVIYKRVANLIDPLAGETPENIIDYTYYVFTNRHVVETEATPEIENMIKVYIGGEIYLKDAIVMGKDAKVDLAVIKFNHPKYIEPAVLGESSAVKAGSFALAIGNPSGYNFYGSVTFGVISHPRRFVQEDYDGDGIIDFNAEYVQHDVAINPGNSGGGLFNLRGELIGMNTMKFVDSKIDNMGFAVPIHVMKLLTFGYLEEGINPPRARLGITVVSVLALTPELIVEREFLPIPEEVTYGLYIANVLPETTIGDSEILAHDILLKFDGKEIYNTIDLTEELSNVVKYSVGTSVEITYYSRAQSAILTTIVTLKP